MVRRLCSCYQRNYDCNDAYDNYNEYSNNDCVYDQVNAYNNYNDNDPATTSTTTTMATSSATACGRSIVRRLRWWLRLCEYGGNCNCCCKERNQCCNKEYNDYDDDCGGCDCDCGDNCCCEKHNHCCNEKYNGYDDDYNEYDYEWRRLPLQEVQRLRLPRRKQ